MTTNTDVIDWRVYVKFQIECHPLSRNGTDHDIQKNRVIQSMYGSLW